MTEDNHMPNFWWCPTHHLYRGGEQRPCADAVRLVPAPDAPQVFFPGDTVPARLWVSYCTPTGIAAAVSNEDWMTLDGAAVELTLPSADEWVAAVDGARAAARRCRCGARRGAEHVRNCTERCQDCGGDPDGPRRCRCRARAERPAVQP